MRISATGKLDTSVNDAKLGFANIELSQDFQAYIKLSGHNSQFYKLFLDQKKKKCTFLLVFYQWEAKVQQGERDFEQISKTIRKEVGRFEASMIYTFLINMITFAATLW